MSRFKLWLSFWRKDHGFGLIESALVLPLFLLITFAVIEFGNIFLSNYQSRDITNDVAEFLQSNPNSTENDLRSFVAGISSSWLKNTDVGQENNIYQRLKIMSYTTKISEETFNDICNSNETIKYWLNPWANGDNDPTNDNNPYYIYVCYPYTYQSITPLPGLTGGILPETRQLRGKAIAYINAQIACPEGQFISRRGGKALCKPIEAICSNEQFMIGINGKTPNCRYMAVVKGSQSSPRVLDETKGVWASPSSNQCRQTWTTTSPGGTSTTCGPSRTQRICGGTKDSRGCWYQTVPGSCTTTRNPNVVTTHDNGRKNWPQYTKNGQIFCTSASVSDPTKPDDKCPSGMVQVGVGSGGAIWCAPLSIQYSTN